MLTLNTSSPFLGNLKLYTLCPPYTQNKKQNTESMSVHGMVLDGVYLSEPVLWDLPGEKEGKVLRQHHPRLNLEVVGDLDGLLESAMTAACGAPQQEEEDAAILQSWSSDRDDSDRSDDE